MKIRSIIFVSISLILSSCSKDKTNFVVNGTLTEASDNYLVLSEMKRESIVTVDSVKTDDMGTFSLKGFTESAKMYVLSMKNTNDYITLVINPEDKITVEIAKFSFPVEYSITGSKDSEMILYTLKKLFTLLNQKVDLNKYYQENIDKQDVMKLREEVKNKIDSLDAAHKKLMTAFIRENASSLGCLPALYQQIGKSQYLFNPMDDFDIYNYVDSILFELYPKAEPVLSLHEQVEKIKTQGIRKGMPVPEINLPNPDGNNIALSSLKGKVVLLDFWASWCKPCRMANPGLVEAYKKYHEKGFEIYQVSLDKSKDAWINAIANDKLDWVHVSDLGYWNSSVVAQYGIEGIPTNYLLDKNGNMIAKNLFGEALELELEKVLK